MFDDMPKRPSALKKFMYYFFVLILLGGLGFIIYQILKPAPSASSSTQATNSPPVLAFDSPSLKPSPSPSHSPTPVSSATPNLQIPAGETYVTFSTADTNGDGKDETLVITKLSSGKYHAYVLSSEGQSLYDNKELPQKPVRISTQTYDPTKESYLSWALIFSENSGDMGFIHWNGTAYETPSMVNF